MNLNKIACVMLTLSAGVVWAADHPADRAEAPLPAAAAADPAAQPVPGAAAQPADGAAAQGDKSFFGSLYTTVSTYAKENPTNALLIGAGAAVGAYVLYKSLSNSDQDSDQKNGTETNAKEDGAFLQFVADKLVAGDWNKARTLSERVGLNPYDAFEDRGFMALLNSPAKKREFAQFLRDYNGDFVRKALPVILPTENYDYVMRSYDLSTYDLAVSALKEMFKDRKLEKQRVLIGELQAELELKDARICSLTPRSGEVFAR
jgi:hypothetical protein